MKIYINPTNEDWICDRIRQEFYFAHPKLCTHNFDEADIAWIISPWAFPYLKPLKFKKNIISIFHIVPEKFDLSKLKALNEVASAFHTICDQTKEFIQNYVTKPIYMEPFWVNQHIWKPEDKIKCREDLNIPLDSFLIGSFQRDTEGSDQISPKLEKGPDQFCHIVESIHKKNHKAHVLLGGWRRQYVMSRLRKSNIPFTYMERPPFKVLNQMYNALDLYIVASRHEGGPQSIPECCATFTPIISTNVGCASSFLNEKSIFTYPHYEACEPTIALHENYSTAATKMVPHGFTPFLKMFENLNENS